MINYTNDHRLRMEPIMKVSPKLLLISTLLASNYAISAGSDETIQQANAAIQQEQFDKAEDLLKSLPSSEQKVFLLGKLELERGELDEAEAYFEKAIKLNKEQANHHYFLGITSMQLATSASIFSAPGYASTAKESLQQAIELQPSHVKAMVSLSQFYIFAPSIVGGDVEKAEELVKQIAKYDEMESLLIERLIYRQQENEEGAIKIAEQLNERFSSSAKAMVAAGFIYQEAEDYSRALNLFELASQQPNEDKHDKSSEMALYQVAKTAVLAEQELEKGTKALESYLQLPASDELPGKDWASFRLAQLSQLKGDKQKALLLAKEAKTQTDDDRLEDELKDFIKQLKKS